MKNFARKLITIWATLGGVVLAGVVLINAVSVVGAIVWQPLPGDFELTQVGVAIAVFAFLPYCQLSGANVTADIFSNGAKPKTISIFKMIGALVAVGFSALLLWRMTLGMFDQFSYGYTTSILRFPHWIAFAINLVSLGLLMLAALLSVAEQWSIAKKSTDHD